ncbi:MAG: hypothetical protein IKC63_01070 [Clostridia bacterium]|nr:hypothetical protein [Clostridia bacterium]
MKRIFLIFSFVLMLAVLVSCTVPVETTEGKTDETTAPVTDQAETTKEIVSLPTPEEIAANTYAAAGLELALTLCRQYYDLETHVLATDLENRNATTVWPLAAFIEMLAEAYRLYPDNETIRTYYIDVLDNCLSQHMVENATIRVPSGKFHRKITYYNAGPNWQGDFYYDDNAWVCIQLIDAYQQLGEKKYLDLAEKVLEFMWTGWDETYGGIYWDKTFSGKGICCNGPVCVAYLAAYELTENKTYLERAGMIYEWCNRMLRNRDGLYNAGIKDITATEYDADNLDPWIAAYDQGTMMTSAALFYRITGDKTYYDDMSKTSKAAAGLIFDGSSKMKGNPIFKSWCIGWAVRGEMSVYAGKSTMGSKRFMQYLDNVLKKVLETKDENGHYDPFFLSGEWWPPQDQPDIGHYDQDAMQPAGVATVLLLTAHYQLYQAEQ